MNRLRQVRKLKGLTIKEVSEDVGIADNTLQQYETEEREPKKEVWIKLADYYDVPVAYLMGLPDGLVQHINKTQAMTFEELHEAIIQWAEDRNMIKQDRLTVLAQFAKVFEEHGELSAGINKNDEDKTKDSLGDIMVTLIILAQDLNLDLLDCLNSAYRVIQNRKGKTINGVFVKESDLHE
ncbi:helix-turn-helix domain-containing protein [Ligilactobacillus salivarius]|uniref:helix-turn-helix domain-containing protein n=1 Tax=Ligilactobacillus salivarius TaxID=1624 RepID=UPI0025A450D6|nr:helix-turn-helix domain-containing protein [Ligilactobacillus salivarius]MDM8273665.1 helix-turn-helix domain-containing protein [Ligilactobacillus salivarius]